MLSDAVVAEFREALRSHSYTPNTIRTYESMFRRVCRELDERDLYNPVTVMQYRLRLKKGSLNIFDHVWSVLHEGTSLRSMPAIVRKPMMAFPHPLFADVMELGALFGNERLPALTWGNVILDPRVGESERRSMLRVFEWFLGRDAMANDETPLVPKDDAGVPMKLWQIEYIINSPRMTPERRIYQEEVSSLLEAVICYCVKFAAPAFLLRHLCDRTAWIGKHARTLDFRAIHTKLSRCPSLIELTGIVEGLPTDPNATEPRFLVGDRHEQRRIRRDHPACAGTPSRPWRHRLRNRGRRAERRARFQRPGVGSLAHR
jgi:hypothetical protein